MSTIANRIAALKSAPALPAKYALVLLDRDNNLLVVVGSENKILSAVTVGTTHNEVKRAYGPLHAGETAQTIADIYAQRWYPVSIRIKYWD